ncbi:MAG: SRPBCC family protein [Acidobacteria bacterium]|nr:SRPBCC family protein [Acidobacteriota bacterium]
MRASIDVDCDQRSVFDFVSDGRNDPGWRTEVDRMDVAGPVALGAQWMEYSTFFKVLHTLTPVVIKELDPPKRVMVETPAQHPFWLRSVREVQAIDDQRSRLTYELAFDLSLLRQITPILPPGWFVAKWYARRIRRYLRNAQRILESEGGA